VSLLLAAILVVKVKDEDDKNLENNEIEI